VRILIALVVSLTGCGFDCDPTKLLADLAGPDATACGVLYRDDGLTSFAAYQCARAHPRFWVAIDPPSADGGEITGYASDGTSSFFVDYQFAIGMGLGPDEEDLRVYRCASLLSPRPCTSLDADLCLSCTDGVVEKRPCHNQ
jgi:hypothetical protein